jgi:hypothetical protein
MYAPRMRKGRANVDPNANLIEQRAIVANVHAIVDACPLSGEYTREQLEALAEYAARLAELAEALDGWIKAGGFLPDSWELARK